MTLLLIRFGPSWSSLMVTDVLCIIKGRTSARSASFHLQRNSRSTLLCSYPPGTAAGFIGTAFVHCMTMCVCSVSVSRQSMGVKLLGAQVTHFSLAQDLVSVSQFSRREGPSTEANSRTIYRSLLAYLATGRRWRQGKELWRPRRHKI